MRRIPINEAKALVARVTEHLRRQPIAGERPPVYGANYPYGRPVTCVTLNAAEGCAYGSIMATDVYGFQFDSPRFFDSGGKPILAEAPAEFHLEDFNPDGMTEAEMDSWIHFIGTGARPQCAKQWFPGMEGMFEHARNVRHYLYNKKAAMYCRKNGNIQDALKYERICDQIYNDLPAIARW
jgi:hypothetical protein